MFLAIFSRIPGNVDGVWYALLLAAFGIGIAFIGVTSNTRRYKTIGTVYIVIAALSQTYNHIPQWAVIGIAGLLILGLGVYLLSKKKN
jgi:LPXTG-motif cell wall-anchored protein